MENKTTLKCGTENCQIQESNKIQDVHMIFLKCRKCNVLRIPPKNLIHLNVEADQRDSNKLIMNFLFEMRLWWLKKELPILENKKINILDVGCGDGQFLRFLKEKGYINLVGIEPDILRSRNAKNGNVPIFLNIKDLRNSKLKHKKADIIFLWHVLEHLDRPITFLSDLKKTLSKHGILIISIPNHLSLQTRLFGYYSSFPDYGRHIWYHDKSYLRHLKKSFPLLDVKSIKDKNYEYEIFSWVDSIASYLTRNQNFIHKTIKKGDARILKKAFAIFLTILVLPLAVILSYVNLSLKKGSTLTFIMRKR